MAAGAINVLHIDDDSEITDLTASLLAREDDALAVETATATETALAHIDSEPVDCVVTDYRMAGVDDGSLLAALDRDHPSLPIIVFTGQSVDDVADAVADRASATVQKRTGSEQYAELATAIRSAVEAEDSD